jgi:hypothetical protein
VFAKVAKLANEHSMRGSKPGERRGGRRKGTPNRKSVAQVEAAAAGGLMPLEHMLGVMCDPGEPVERRLAAAVAAARYCHCKLKAIEHTGEDSRPIAQKVILSFD